MFLISSIYLKEILKKNKKIENTNISHELNLNKKILETKSQLQKETVDQLKSVEQEEKIVSAPEVKNQVEYIQIKTFENLIKLCEEKKELKIKYELENNLRLVSFNENKIEISFNSNLDKSFVKELSAKLLEWTNKRWIIAFSKENGLPTLKENKKDIQANLLKKASETEFSKEFKKIFPDAELFKIEDDNN